MSSRVSMVIAMAIVGLGAGTAHASQALGDWTDPHRWQVRARAIGVVPDESSSTTIGGSIDVGDALVPEVDITYFWSEHWAMELIAATASHSIGGVNTALGNLDLGSVWLLPPTLTLQYHFMPEASVQPYIGAGVNYTWFYNVDKGQVNSISYDDSFGVALQAGVDIPVDDHWAFNLDVKRLWLNTEATVNGAVKADVDIDPWILGVGIRYRF